MTEAPVETKETTKNNDNVTTIVTQTTFPAENVTPTPDIAVSSIVYDFSVQLGDCWTAISPAEERAIMADLTNTFGSVDTSQFIKQKMGLSYLSWAKAWELVLDVVPDAHYDLITFNGNLYREVGNTAMVFTSIELNGVRRYMWLPVMNQSNKCVPIKDITALDVNKAWMRCLVKNLAMFKLGINLYNGDDLPSDVKEARKELQAKIARVTKLGMAKVKTDKEAVQRIMAEYNDGDSNPANIKSVDACDKIIAALNNIADK